MIQLIFLCFSFMPFLSRAQENSSAVFSFHLYSEPSSMDPHQLKSSSSNYVVNNLFRNLYWIDQKGQLQNDLGDACKPDKKHQTFVCNIKKTSQWSDGSPLTSDDFISSYQRILSPQTQSPKADFLFEIKGAQDFYKGLVKDIVGLKKISDQSFSITLEKGNFDFLFKLASPLSAPIKKITKNPTEMIFSGPYKIKSWAPGKKITLESNLFYWKKSKRPWIEVYFIQEDSVALHLYETKELSFLRRLPTLFIPSFSSRNDFKKQQVFRFDYFGFSGKLSENKEQRKALAESLDYSELRKIFSAEGDPGCIGLPVDLTTKELCYKQNKTSSLWKKDPGLNLIFSTQGGDDHKRVAEWLQAQWKKNLNISVQIRAVENKIFLEELKKSPDIFRKGLGPDVPTCASALEDFVTGATDNYLNFSNAEFDKVYKKLVEAKNQKTKNQFCFQALKILMDDYKIIPTGAMYFSYLVHPNWKNVYLNPMNQLDLSDIESAQ